MAPIRSEPQAWRTAAVMSRPSQTLNRYVRRRYNPRQAVSPGTSAALYFGRFCAIALDGMLMALNVVTLRNLRMDSPSPDEREVRVRAGRADWCVRESWRDRLVGPEAPDWFALPDEPRARQVKPGHLRTVWQVALADRTVFAKVACAGRFLERLKWLFLGAPGEREWRVARRAESRGVPVIRGLAVGVRQGRPLRAAFLTEAVDGAFNLADAWPARASGGQTSQRRTVGRALIEAVAALLATAHERGFVHRDGHPRNILVRFNSEGTPLARYVDVHASRLARRPPRGRRLLRSLAQLDHSLARDATRSERLRFLRSYLARRSSLSLQGADPVALRRLLATFSQASKAHANRLARHRDRRLHRDGKYFSTVPLGKGWRARAVLRLERRHVFPEAEVPDRTRGEWQVILGAAAVTESNRHRVIDLAPGTGLLFEIRRPDHLGERLSWTLRGSPHRRAFERCHRRRHRDLPAELLLAYMEHRTTGLVDATVLVRPDRPGDQQPDPRTSERNSS